MTTVKVGGAGAPDDRAQAIPPDGDDEMFPQSTLKHDLTAMISGLAVLCVGAIGLISAGGFLLWMAGVQ